MRVTVLGLCVCDYWPLAVSMQSCVTVGKRLTFNTFGSDLTMATASLFRDVRYPIATVVKAAMLLSNVVGSCLGSS